MKVKRVSARGFWTTVSREVKRRAKASGREPGNGAGLDCAFQQWIAELILATEPGFSAQQADVMLCSGHQKSDLVLEDQAGSRLLIVQARYQPRRRAIVESQVSDFFNRHEKYVNREWVLSHGPGTGPSSGSGTVPDELLDYGEKIDSGYSVAYYFVSTGVASPRLFDFARACSTVHADQGLRIACEVFDFARLKDYWEQSMSRRALIEVASGSDAGQDNTAKARLLSIIRGIGRGKASVYLRGRCNSFISLSNIKGYLAKEKDIRVAILVTVIAVVAILVTSIVQSNSNSKQVRLRRYEVTFIEMQKGYSSLIDALTDLRGSFETSSLEEFSNKAARVESRYFAVEPFLKEKTRTELWRVIQSYIKGSRESKIRWESAQQKKDSKKDEAARARRSGDDHEGIFLSHRARVRDVFLKAMSQTQ